MNKTIPLDEWQKVYSSQFEHKVHLVKAVLKSEGIEAVILNQQDSLYLFGEVELFVQPDDVLRSRQIILKEEL